VVTPWPVYRTPTRTQENKNVEMGMDNAIVLRK
jgi:hypothetical protein